jgi:hypothetical protein
MNPILQNLGRVKYWLLEDLPSRRQNAKVPYYRQELWKHVEKLPSVPKASSSNIEVHMLCGHRDAAMGVFSSWSLLRFLNGEGTLYIHSDGTITEEDIFRWNTVIPGIILISKEEADQRVAIELKNSTKYLYNWRCNYGMSAQVVDYHLFGETSKIISMDSDVLIFNPPDEFITFAQLPDMNFIWCEDFQNAYVSHLDYFRELFNIVMPFRFNAGMMITPRFSQATFQEIDEIMHTMEQDGRVGILQYWAAQTYFAILAARSENKISMPKSYEVHKGRTRPNSILRHYVGIPQIRYRYFTEGIPLLLNQLGI